MNHLPYELAKELKDAGFPPSNVVIFKEPPKAGEYVDLYDTEKEWATVPTLSELIEACEGTNFISLTNTNLRWDATGQRGSIGERVYGHGSTPEEAVARLWLALHKNTNEPS